MDAYMKGKISAKELDRIAKEDFKSSVATKKELKVKVFSLIVGI